MKVYKAHQMVVKDGDLYTTVESEKKSPTKQIQDSHHFQPLKVTF